MTYICDICNGNGIVWEVWEKTQGQFKGNTFPKTCSKCKGSGELNWVENIFGKNKNYIHNEWEDRYYDI